MSNKTFVAALVSFKDDGMALTPLVLYAANEQDAYLTALIAAEKQLFPLSDGWAHHRVRVEAIENIAKAIEVDPTMAINEIWSLQERIDQAKEAPHAD